ncbi:MAG: response regulator [Desulfobacterales bacterium]
MELKAVDNENCDRNHLREKLAEAEELIKAIRNGHVDALVVSGPEGDRVYTLQGADHTYRLLIETVSEGAVILSEEGVILYCNRRYSVMAQRSRKSLRGSFMSELIATGNRHEFDSLFKRALTEDVKAESLLDFKSGESMPILLSMRSLLIEETRTVCMVVTDLTAQKLSEKELKLRSEQLQLLALQVSDAEDRERRKIAMILHDDLQQCLAAARFQIEMLTLVDGKDLTEKARHLIDLVDESMNKCRSLTYELSPPILEQNGLLSAIKWLASDMRQKYGLTVVLQADLKGDLRDPVLAKISFRAIRELLFNVVKHSGGAEKALIELNEAGDYIEISVSDQGKGFELDLYNNRKNDSGFGLFGLKERMHIIGGRIEIESAIGQGCCVRLYFPREEFQNLEEITAEPMGKSSLVHRSKWEQKGSNQIRILIADDHAVMRDGLANLLRVEENFEVVGQAGNGIEAVRLVQELNPDIVLMDVSMPELDGIKATAQIVKENAKSCIIGLSMHDDPDTKARMIKAGACAYLCKSDSGEKIRNVIRSVFSNSQ